MGAGGIGELMTNIKLDRYDQVSMTLLLIIVVVSVLDYVSGELRKRVVEGQNDSGHSGVGGNAAPVETTASGDLRAAGRYLRTVGLIALAIVLYYVFFFPVFGISWPQFINGCQQLGRYFLRMFVWHDFVNWPFMYYFQQIGITIAIVFAGTITASLIALPLSFFAARNVMSTPLLRPISVLVRRLLDVLRGIDMAIWGLIFVRAVGMGPLAGVLAIVMQDVGLLGKLYAEGHEAVDKSPAAA